jgi:IS30 family transposase
MPHQCDSITQIRICWSLYQNGVSPEEIPGQLGKNRATIYRWIKGIKLKGIVKFIRDYKQAKKGRRRSRKTDVLTKLHIYKIRTEKRNCCGEKIQYFLKHNYNETVSVSTIYRVLNEKYRLKSKWKKYCKRGHVKKGEKPRESIQADTVDFGQVYAFTAIDTCTKEASVILKEKLDAQSGKEALKEQLQFFGKIEHIQKDGGSEFKKEWQQYAHVKIKSIRTARPYKKNEQAFIERFNGILRKECLGYLKYKPKDIPEMQKRLNEFLNYYHNERPHLSLNMLTPKEYAMSHLT